MEKGPSTIGAAMPSFAWPWEEEVEWRVGNSNPTSANVASSTIFIQWTDHVSFSALCWWLPEKRFIFTLTRPPSHSSMREKRGHKRLAQPTQNVKVGRSVKTSSQHISLEARLPPNGGPNRQRGRDVATKRSGATQKHTTPGIHWSPPTQLLIWPLKAYVLGEEGSKNRGFRGQKMGASFPLLELSVLRKR